MYIENIFSNKIRVTKKYILLSQNHKNLQNNGPTIVLEK